MIFCSAMMLWNDALCPSAESLVAIGSAQWTVATYFPFIMYPDEYMFLKPIVTSKAADICAFELNYKSDLNWVTYEKLMEFSQYLRKETLRPETARYD